MADELDTTAGRAWVEAFGAAVEAHREELTNLDRRSGDGDFGSNLVATVGRFRSALATTETESVGNIFAAISTAFVASGGTSGPLFGVWFRELAVATADRKVVDLGLLAAAATNGVEAVQRLGGANEGDKTMVDAMVPAARALASAVEEKCTLADGLAAAACAARTGADATAALVARRGRASYVGDAALGVKDPGAVTFALFFEAISM